MNRSTWSRILFGTCLLALLSVHQESSFAAEKVCQPGPYEYRTGAMLNLTEEQEQTLADIRCKYQPLLAEASSLRTAAHEQFYGNLENINEEEDIREAFQKVALAEEDLAVLQVQMNKNIREMMTVEQHELMQAIIAVQRMKQPDKLTSQR